MALGAEGTEGASKPASKTGQGAGARPRVTGREKKGTLMRP